MVATNRDYWDCECETGYIHYKDEQSCPICGAFRDEGQPDAHQNEVEAQSRGLRVVTISVIVREEDTEAVVNNNTLLTEILEGVTVLKTETRYALDREADGWEQEWQ